MARKKKTDDLYEGLSLTVDELDAVKSNSIMSQIKVNVKPKNDNQKLYWKHLRDTKKEIVICGGAPGCGKSYLSFAYALKALKDNEYEQVKILIPTVEASSALRLGFLPGSLEAKVEPFQESAKYLIDKILKQGEVESHQKVSKYLIDSGKVSFEVMSYIRGRNFDNTLLLLEESENLSKEEMLLAITRCGEGSKIVISGDSRQSDRKYMERLSGLEHAMNVLERLDEVGVVRFKDDDVVRNDIITKILNVW
jgi:phosphate starvation-inducible PhoH-like protein